MAAETWAKDLGEVVRGHRRAAGLTQLELAVLTRNRSYRFQYRPDYDGPPVSLSEWTAAP